MARYQGNRIVWEGLMNKIMGFAIELNQDDVDFIKRAYNIDSDGKVRNWMQLAFDLLLERIKSIDSELNNANRN